MQFVGRTLLAAAHTSFSRQRPSIHSVHEADAGAASASEDVTATIAERISVRTFNRTPFDRAGVARRDGGNDSQVFAERERHSLFC
jgi:hypothetical protein